MTKYKIGETIKGSSITKFQIPYSQNVVKYSNANELSSVATDWLMPARAWKYCIGLNLYKYKGRCQEKIDWGDVYEEIMTKTISMTEFSS